MVLNEELLAIQRGEQGEAMRKVLNTLVMYGEAFGAERMVKITGRMGHAVIGTGSMTWKPVFDLMEELIEGGALPRQSFTTDPRGVEPHVPMSFKERAMFRLLFSGQKRMEQEWGRMGIKDKNAYTCTAYMEEVGNIPQYGDILGWAESSAVSYANSVIGARCNRNSGILELMSNILGYVPEFGLLTDEGRKADWIIEVRCQNMPEPQLLGSAIGFKCIEDVPYIRGLDKWLGTELTQTVKDYLKDMGAAAASNGSVGLYHVENITPEAVKHALPPLDEAILDAPAEDSQADSTQLNGQQADSLHPRNSLIKEDAKVFVIDDAEIARVKASYPNPWPELKGASGAPQLAFAGCPHFSCEQLRDWTDRLAAGLERHGNDRVAMTTIFCAAPDVSKAFSEKYPERARKLKEIGVTVSGLCPLSYTSNPLTDKIRIITASNKLRYYSKARFFSEEELVEIITGGWKEKWEIAPADRKEAGPALIGGLKEFGDAVTDDLKAVREDITSRMKEIREDVKTSVKDVKDRKASAKEKKHSKKIKAFRKKVRKSRIKTIRSIKRKIRFKRLLKKLKKHRERRS